jgi:Prokaryotic lipoprotein-attachment site
MSAFSSTERPDRPAAGRRIALALLALGMLAACGKKGSLRLPKPGEPGYEGPPAKPKAQPEAQPKAQPEAQPEAQP